MSLCFERGIMSKLHEADWSPRSSSLCSKWIDVLRLVEGVGRSLNE